MLFHKEVYWHDSFDEQSLVLINSIKRLSNHVYDNIASGRSRYNIDIKKLYLIVKSIDKSNCHPFEVEVEKGKVVKCIIRMKYDDKRDISIVVRDEFIVTAFLNMNTDNHATLDKSKYERGLNND